jgi:hypothetical protein
MFSTPFFRPTGAPPMLLLGSQVVETEARDDPLTTQKARSRGEGRRAPGDQLVHFGLRNPVGIVTPASL